MSEENGTDRIMKKLEKNRYFRLPPRELGGNFLG